MSAREFRATCWMTGNSDCVRFRIGSMPADAGARIAVRASESWSISAIVSSAFFCTSGSLSARQATSGERPSDWAINTLLLKSDAM